MRGHVCVCTEKTTKVLIPTGEALTHRWGLTLRTQLPLKGPMTCQYYPTGVSLSMGFGGDQIILKLEGLGA